MVCPLGGASRFPAVPDRVGEVTRAKTAAVVGERVSQRHRDAGRRLRRDNRGVAVIVRVAKIHLPVRTEEHIAVESDRLRGVEDIAYDSALELEGSRDIVRRLDRHDSAVFRVLRVHVSSVVGAAYLRETADASHRTENVYEPHQIVAPHVEDDSAARAEREPSLRVGAPPLVVVSAHERYVRRHSGSEHTAVIYLSRCLESGAEIGVGAAAVVHSALLRGLHEILALPQLDRHHLFGVDVLSGEHRFLRDLIVRGVVGEVHDKLDFRIVPDLLVRHLTDAVFLRLFGGPLRLYVGAADHLDRVVALRHVRKIDIRDHSAADDRGLYRSEWVHFIVPSFLFVTPVYSPAFSYAAFIFSRPALTFFSLLAQ